MCRMVHVDESIRNKIASRLNAELDDLNNYIIIVDGILQYFLNTVH